MKVALFGARGFVGRSVSLALQARGHTVSAPPREGVDLGSPGAFDALSQLSVEADVVINCAARVPASSDTLVDSQEMFAVNSVGAGQVAHWAGMHGVRRIVHASTLAVVQRPWPVPLSEDAPTYPLGPVAAYGASKLGGELVCQSIAANLGVACVVLRFSALYGVGMAWTGVLPSFVDTALTGGRLQVSNGGHADFLHVSDAARAVVTAAEGGCTGVVNVASGVETSLVDLAALTLMAAGRPESDVDVADSPVARAVVDTRRMRELGMTAEVTLREGVDGLISDRQNS